MHTLFHRFVIVAALVVVSLVSSVCAWGNRQDSVLEYYNTAKRVIREGDYANSLNNYLVFLRYAENESSSYPRELMEGYGSVSVIYGSFNDYNRSLEYALKSYAISRRLGDPLWEMRNLNNAVQCFIALKRYREAEMYLEKLLNVKGVDRTKLEFDYAISKGCISRLRGEWEDAGHYWMQAWQIADDNSYSNYTKVEPLLNLADFYAHKEMPDSQQVYLLKAKSLADAQTDPYPKINVARGLMKFYTEHGNTGEALKYQNSYFHLVDSLMNLEKFLSASSRHELGVIKDKDEKIGTLSITVSKQKMAVLVILAVALVICAVLFIIYKQKKRLHKAYLEVVELNRELLRMEEQNCTSAQQKAEETDAARQTAALEPEQQPEPRLDAEQLAAADEEVFGKIKQVVADGNEIYDPDFSLARLALLVSSDVVSVSRIINEKTKGNVPTFINRQRIKEACRRMTEEHKYGNLTIQAIGESVGFKTQVNFNRTFKKMMGITPSAYKKIVAESR